MAHRRGKVLLEIAALLIGGAAVMIAVILWRATQGPMGLDFIKPFATAELRLQTGLDVDLDHIFLGSEGWGAPVELQLRGVDIRTQNRSSSLVLPSVDVRLSFRALLKGQIRVVDATVTGPSLAGVRQPDGSYDFGCFGLGNSSGNTADPLRGLLSPDPKGVLARWRRFTVKDGALKLSAEPGASPLLSLSGLQFEVARQPQGATLDFSGMLKTDNTEGPMFAYAQLDQSERGTLKLHLAGVPLDVVAGLHASMAPLRPVQVPVSLDVNGEFDGLNPKDVRVELGIGPGQIVDPSHFPQPLAVKGGHIAFRYTGNPERVRLDDFTVTMEGLALKASGEAATEAGTTRFDLDGATTSDLKLDDFDRFWPYGVSNGGRAWVTANLSQGVVSKATVHAEGSAPRADLGALDVSALAVGLDVAGARVHYFGKLPDVEDAAAHIDLGLRALTIHLAGGHAKDVQVAGGTVVIDQFDKKDQDISIDLDLTGPLSSMMEILDAAPLHYAKKLNIDAASMAGSADIAFHMAFPLLAVVTPADMTLSANAALHEALVPHVVKGLPLQHLNGDLAVDMNGLELRGKGDFGATPVTLDWKQSFDSKASPISDGTFEGELADKGRTELGIGAPDYLTGPVHIAGHYLDYGDTASVALKAGLTEARFQISEIGYDKPPGAKGDAGFTLELAHGNLTAIKDIDLRAKDLHAEGEAALDPETGALSDLKLRAFEAGDTSLQVDAAPMAGGGSRIQVKGPVFDARGLLHKPKKASARPADTAQGTPTPLEIDADIGWVETWDQGGLRNLKGRIDLLGSSWRLADFSASAEGHPIVLTYLPDSTDPAPAHTLKASTDDLGAALSGFGLTQSLGGGVLGVEGRRPAPTAENPSPPLAGTLKITDFTVIDPPVFAQLFNLLSVKGFMETVSGKGIEFKSLGGDFSIDGDVIALRNGKLSGSAIGLTIDGSVDRASDRLNLYGDAVPAYDANTFLQKVPVIGYLLTGDKGEGMFSTTYTITGPFENPSVFINPVSMLTPGILRDLLFEWPWKNG